MTEMVDLMSLLASLPDGTGLTTKVWADGKTTRVLDVPAGGIRITADSAFAVIRELLVRGVAALQRENALRMEGTVDGA